MAAVGGNIGISDRVRCFLSFSLMEEAWLATPNRATLTSWRPGYIQKFIRQIGTDYDYLFSEHSAKFIPNGGSSRHFNDVAVITLQAGQLALRFVRDRGDFWVEFAPQNGKVRWVNARDMCLFVLLDGRQDAVEDSSLQIKLPSISEVLRDHFEAFERALSAESFDGTLVGLSKIMQMKYEGRLDVFNIRPDSGFLANYAKISDEIGRVPFWKPLAIYAGTILSLPLLLLAVLIGGLFLWFRKRTRRNSVQIARR